MSNAFAFTPKRVGVFYFKEKFGIIHELEDEDSPSQKVIKCGYPLEVFDAYHSGKDNEWAFVKTGSVKGFIPKKFLSKRWPRCFLRNYSQFFGEFQMTKMDLYFWAKYIERVAVGKSKAH